jgi:predicted histone-like DNA-binding protein
MAIICTLEKKRTDNRYYARTRKTGRVGFAQFAEEISRNCSAKPSDVILVLTELCEVMRHHLLNGKEIIIPDLGSFHIGIQSDSVETPSEFTPSKHIHALHIKFRPHSRRDPTTWKLSHPMLENAKIKFRPTPALPV